MFLHEIKQTFADPRRLILVFGASLAYLILFAMLYSPNIVKNIPTIIFDADNTKISREFLRGFDDNDSFAIVGYAACEEDMQRALIDKTALAAIEVPKNFSRDIAHGSAEFLYMVNGSNIIVTSATSSAAQNISADFSDKIAAQRAAAALGSNVNDLAKKISPVREILPNRFGNGGISTRNSVCIGRVNFRRPFTKNFRRVEIIGVQSDFLLADVNGGVRADFGGD